MPPAMQDTIASSADRETCRKFLRVDDRAQDRSGLEGLLRASASRAVRARTASATVGGNVTRGVARISVAKNGFPPV